MSNSFRFFESTLWKFALLPILRLILALFFVLLPVGLIQIVVQSVSPPDFGLTVFTCLAVPTAFLAYWGYARWIEKRNATEIAPSGAPSEFGLGLLTGAGLFTTAIGIIWILGYYRVTGLNPWSVLIDSLTLSVLSGFLEELITRGIIFRIIEDVLGTWIALALSALLFGMMHLGNPHATWASAMAIALEAGLLLGACYVLTRRLWMAIGLHLAWNFVQGGIFGVAVSGTTVRGILQSTLTGPEILSGGAFGVEASVVAVVVCVSGFVYIIFRARRQGRIVSPFWMRKEKSPAP
jgi:membrane protease YdiL (CAAX protease family)